MKKILSSMLGTTLLLFSSCMQEARIESPVFSQGDVKMIVEIEDFGGAPDMAKTRGLENTWSVNGENTITNLYLLFFDPSSKAYMGYGQVTLNTPEQLPPYGGAEMNVDGFAFPDGKSAGAYKILALANISQGNFVESSIQDWMSQWNGKTLDQVKVYAMGTLPPAAIASNSLPMYGEFDKPADETQVHLKLNRIVSRLDVTNNIPDYALVSVSVWNSFPSTMIWDGGIVDYSDNTERIRNHYGLTITETEKPGEPGVMERTEKLRGGIYAFENQVLKPSEYDNVTTCLIIGLQKKGTDGKPTGSIEYYRANIQDATETQNLRRNYAYNLVINRRGGKGETTEEIAYLGKGNQLFYYVGDWNEYTNGLVVSDDYSTMSIPTKTVNMGNHEEDGATAEIKVHTFSTLASPAPLQIHSQTYRPAHNTTLNKPSIEARLEGNTLIIKATPLETGQENRNGVIVLSYAGLEIALNVSQSGKHNDYLIVTEPDGGILPFAPHGGLPAGFINVQASDHWTARLYMSGFSFDDNTAVDPVKWIWTNAGGTFNDGRGENNYGTLIQSDATDIDKFRVHTHSSNETNSIREAFIIVQLDKDPENYTALITLSQTFVKKLKYYPLFWDYTVDPATPRPLPTNVEDANGAGWMEQGGTIMFDGVGNLMTGDGYSNNTDTYYVQTSRNDATLWIPWTPVIVATGLNDDRAHFAIDTEVTSTDNEDLFLNRVRIKAKSMNLTGTDRMVKLRVQTDAQTYAEIPVIQKPAVWNLPATPPAFDADGGYEELILDAPTGMHYTVEVESLTGAENHFAYLNDPDDPYDPNAGEDSRPKYSKLLAEDATKPFIVGFPKLIYPNLYSSVSATIKVTMVESGQSKSFTIMQLPPQQKTVNILGIGSISHGGISNNANKPGYTYNPTVTSGSDNDGGDESAANGNWWGYYCGAWARNLHDPAHFGNLSTSAVKISTVVPGMANTNIANSGDVWASASAAATLVHFSRPGETTGHQAVNTTLWNWVNGTSQMAPGSEGVLHVSLEDVDEAEADRAFSYAIFGENGMEITGGQEDSVFPYKLPAVQEGRLWDYLKAGPFASEVTQTVLGYTWYMEGNSSFMNTSSVTDAGAIPILVGTSLNHNRSTVPVGTAEGWCGLFIDPVRRIVVRADSEFVRNQVEMNGIVNNVQAWMIETAQWGTHFSEYFWESPRYTMPEPQPQPQP